MYAKDYRHAAWAKLSGNWSTVVVAYLIYTALIGVLSSTGIGVFLFDGVFQVGMAIIMISHDLRSAMKYATHILSFDEPVFYGTKKAFAERGKQAYE